MKRLQYLLAPAMLLFFLMSCTQESDGIDENYDLTLQITTSAQAQDPNPALDTSEKGIYHGIIASTTTQSRGKVWVNVGNNGHYNAYIEMVGGDIFQLDLDQQSIAEDDGNANYIFRNAEGSFNLNLNDINQPIVTDAAFNNEIYTINVLKSRSQNRASAITATFQETEPFSSFAGTWNLISDGVVTNPNGLNGEAITSIVITMNGDVYTDLVFDTFNGTNCLGVSAMVPVLNMDGISGHIVSAYQTSEFAAGVAKWGIGYDPVTAEYTDYLFCEAANSGYFEWTNDQGTLTRIGEINVD